MTTAGREVGWSSEDEDADSSDADDEDDDEEDEDEERVPLLEVLSVGESELP